MFDCLTWELREIRPAELRLKEEHSRRASWLVIAKDRIA
jgi:hypothetical protein